MENELRFYLNQMLDVINSEKTGFTPQYFITAVRLPNGAIELAVNNSNIKEKIGYILEAYDENMHLKTNSEIEMIQLMVV